MKASLKFYHPETLNEVNMPLFVSGVKAGFPSPADDFIEKYIDLNKAFVKHKEATFYARVSGNSMINAGLNDGDLLIIDRSLEPQNNKIAVCYIDGEFTVKRLKIEKDIVWLIAENDSYEPIKTTKDNDLVIWGIVTTVIKKV